MARKNYTDEFRQRAVDLYESTLGAMLKGIAEDLGIVRGTLAQWVGALGSGTTTGSTGSTPTPTPTSLSSPGLRPESQLAKITRLEAQVGELEADKTTLSTEREILRSAAKYFAGGALWRAASSLLPTTEKPSR